MWVQLNPPFALFVKDVIKRNDTDIYMYYLPYENYVFIFPPTQIIGENTEGCNPYQMYHH